MSAPADIAANVDAEINRTLELLRTRIASQGHTQLSVQERMGWGRSYISQFLTRQKGLRMDTLLSVLEVIDLPAAEFFAELYGPATTEKVADLERRLNLVEAGLFALRDQVVSRPPDREGPSST